MYLIGARDSTDGREWDYSEVVQLAEEYGVSHTVIMDSDFDTILGSLDDKRWYEAEGFVMNIDGFRVKIKYHDYLQRFRQMASLDTPNGILKAYREGYLDEVISGLPDEKNAKVQDCLDKIRRFEETQNEKVNAELTRLYNSHPEDRREAMLWILDNIEDKWIGRFVRSRYLGETFDILKNAKFDHNGNLEYRRFRYLRYDAVIFPLSAVFIALYMLALDVTDNVQESGTGNHKL